MDSKYTQQITPEVSMRIDQRGAIGKGVFRGYHKTLKKMIAVKLITKQRL